MALSLPPHGGWSPECSVGPSVPTLFRIVSVAYRYPSTYTTGSHSLAGGYLLVPAPKQFQCLIPQWTCARQNPFSLGVLYVEPSICGLPALTPVRPLDQPPQAFAWLWDVFSVFAVFRPVVTTNEFFMNSPGHDRTFSR